MGHKTLVYLALSRSKSNKGRIYPQSGLRGTLSDRGLAAQSGLEFQVTNTRGHRPVSLDGSALLCQMGALRSDGSG